MTTDRTPSLVVPMPSRANARVKAARYLVERRFAIDVVHGSHVHAVCRGDTGIYVLGHRRGRGWYCSCPARSVECAHLIALRSLVVFERVEVGR